MKTMNEFDDIRPYFDSEIPDAMHRIASDPMFPTLASYVFPDRDIEEVRGMVASISGTGDFQRKVMHQANLRIIEDSITGFTYEGIERIDPDKRYLYVSNHRDIMLDASLLQSILLTHNMDTSEITFGANLMKGQLVIDIGKSNKMFRVERPGGSIREFYKASAHLSGYIRMTLLEKRQSVWIAQRNGRTKDGIDRTDQGIINMFRMSGTSDKVRAISELNILPISISYEWEPCDILKVLELNAGRNGTYTKKEGEDLNSILTGIMQPKGKVHFTLCEPVTEDDLKPWSNLTSNEFNKKVASLIDSRICSGYALVANNYIAHDLRSGSCTYQAHYTAGQKKVFTERMRSLGRYAAGSDLADLESLFLGIYANPVDSKELFKEDR